MTDQPGVRVVTTCGAIDMTVDPDADLDAVASNLSTTVRQARRMNEWVSIPTDQGFADIDATTIVMVIATRQAATEP